MKNRVIAALLAVLVVVSGALGYWIGQYNQPNPGPCLVGRSVQGAVPAGATLSVSYESNWRLSFAEFASNQTKASALSYVCYYEGSGTTSFYVSYANYQGWNTILALAHKLGTTGTLTLNVAGGGSSSVNSTALSYGDASIAISFFI